MKTHTRLAHWVLLCGVLAACAGESFAPVVVAPEWAATTDSSSYHLLVWSDPEYTVATITGKATFRNITDRTLYIMRTCYGPSMHLERVDGERIPMHSPYCLYDSPPPYRPSPPSYTAVASGDSVVVPFSFSAEVSDSLADATIPTLIGDAQLVFDVGQHVFGSPQPEPASREFGTSAVFTISPQ